MGITTNTSVLMPEYLYALLTPFDISVWASDARPPSMRKTVVEKQKIPLPPLEVQQEIVAEIEGYQKVIDGARELIGHTEEQIRATIARVWGGEEDSLPENLK